MQSLQEPYLDVDQVSQVVNSNNAQSDTIKRLLSIQANLTNIKSRQISFATPISFIRNIPLLFPYTITIIQGQKGQHKSRLSEHITSAFLSKNKEIPDSIGLTVENRDDFVVVLIDTERNLNDQLPFALQKIQTNAGYDISENQIPFEFTSLLNEERHLRYQALDEYISYLRKKHIGKHLIVILDVMSDCIENFNDPASSLKLVDMMNKTINEQNVTYICVIHENPGSEKARGHLGSEVVNKASLVLQIGFDKSIQNSEVIKLTFLHCRSIKRPDPIYLVYDNQSSRLASANPDDIRNIKSLSCRTLNIDDFKAFLATEISFPIKTKDLFEKVSKRFSISKRTFDDIMKEMVEAKAEIEIGSDTCFISKERIHREINFIISPIKSQ